MCVRGEVTVGGGGVQFCSQGYFYYTNRGAHIYLGPGGNTPPAPPLGQNDMAKSKNVSMTGAR